MSNPYFAAARNFHMRTGANVAKMFSPASARLNESAYRSFGAEPVHLATTSALGFSPLPAAQGLWWVESTVA